jgi:hypothetical protein
MRIAAAIYRPAKLGLCARLEIARAVQSGVSQSSSIPFPGMSPVLG